jgi:hypothetical protein
MPFIVETIVTTCAPDGTINVAPMGVEWDEATITLKPFLETTTFRNIRDAGTAVVNLTDDVLLFARGAIGRADAPTVPAEHTAGVRLAAACGWRELQTVELDATPPRSRIVMRVVHRGRGPEEMLGFNRGRHAVLEAAILATRTHLLPAAEIAAEFARLRVLMDKTAGPREWEAWRLLTAHVARAGVTVAPDVAAPLPDAAHGAPHESRIAPDDAGPAQGVQAAKGAP